MNFVLTFLEGLASFVSPCLLPLLPVYVAYFTADGADARTALARSSVFVLGFASVFVTLGVFAGGIGAAFAYSHGTVQVVCGALVVLFGLVYLGLIRLPFKQVALRRRSPGLPGAFVFGAVFSVSLTPCVGAFLGAALMQAASAGGAWKGAALLAVYSAGLGVPFVASAVLLGKLSGAIGFIKRHYDVINPVCGIMLVVFGIGLALAPLWRYARREAALSHPVVEEPREAASAEPTVYLTPWNFEAEVLGSDRPVLLEFWSEGCEPCRMLAPHLDVIEREMKGSLKVFRINIEAQPEFLRMFRIPGFPTLGVFKDGKLVASALGYRELADLRQFVTSAVEEVKTVADEREK